MDMADPKVVRHPPDPRQGLCPCTRGGEPALALYPKGRPAVNGLCKEKAKIRKPFDRLRARVAFPPALAMFRGPWPECHGELVEPPAERLRPHSPPIGERSSPGWAGGNDLTLVNGLHTPSLPQAGFYGNMPQV